MFVCSSQFPLAAALCHYNWLMKAAKTSLVTDDPDKGAVAGVLDELWSHKPPFVKGFGLETGEDHTGDPAIWIYLKVTKDNNPSRSKVVALRKFADEVQQRVLDRRLDRWPYVRISEVR